MSDKPTLLIVDAEPGSLQTLCQSLNSESNLVFATSGEQAVNVATEMKSIDTILLNTQLPDISGFEACARLKSEDRLKTVPMVFLAEQMNDDDLAQCLRCGGVDYFTRSMPLAWLNAKLKSLLEFKHKTDLLTEIALLDGLTSIPNRDRFEEYLDIEWRRSLREFNTLAMIYVDIDSFTAFNEAYGLAAGDECLKRIARLMQNNCLRAADMVARYDDDEFVALLPGTELDNVLLVAEKMVEAAAQLNISHDGSSQGFVSISAGVVTIDPGQDNKPTDLLDEVEEMLIQAQQSGGNQVQGIAL